MIFETISANQLDNYVGNDNYYIIDLRSPEEYSEGHIQGAVNIPYEQLDQIVNYPKEKEYIFYCIRGNISLTAARMLSRSGYRIKTVIGGIRMYSGPNYVRRNQTVTGQRFYYRYF